MRQTTPHQRRSAATAVALGAAVLVAVAAPATAAAAAPAADTSAPQVRSIAFAKASSTVNRLETDLVEVRVRLTDETGVDPYEWLPGDFIDFSSPRIELNTESNRFVVLHLAEGTPQDGVWVGQVPVTSAWNQTVEPTRVIAVDVRRNRLDVDPRTVVDTPTLTVHGSHRPVLQMWFTPEPVAAGQRVTQFIRARDADTGVLWAQLPLHLVSDNECIESAGGLPVRTGAGGVYQRVLPQGGERFLQCARVVGTAQPGMSFTPTLIAGVSQFVRRQRYVIKAVPVRSAVPARTNVNVNGTITPHIASKQLRLQRRYPDGVWRTVNTGVVTNGGKFTVVATPPGKATYSYRVYAPTDDSVIAGYSPAFPIRGT